jgi:lipoate synthase
MNQKGSSLYKDHMNIAVIAVDRDDLKDGGSLIWIETVKRFVE